MSSPCWSLPHLPTSSPPQHEAPPGQHDLLQDDTLHRTPLPEPIQSTSSSQEPLSNVNCESDGNPRTKTPTPSGAEHEMWIYGYRVEYWTAAVWITVDIVTCCILMVSTWWKAGRVVETTDSGAQALEEGRHVQCTPTRIMITKNVQAVHRRNYCPFLFEITRNSFSGLVFSLPSETTLRKRAWRRRIEI